MRRIFLLLVFLLPSAITFAQSLNTKKLDSLFDILDSAHLAMGSVAIAKDGKIVYRRQIGYAYIDGNKKIPANADTKYRIGSITKMFTAVIIFQLIEEKKLSLDTKLAKFYPQIPNADKITIEMLLRHRSGLYDYVNDDADSAWLNVPQSNQIILQKIIDGKPHFAPDSATDYCNSGYWLLSRIAEKVAKESYDKLLAQRIIHKIHMQNTNVDSVTDENKNESSSYYWHNDSLKFEEDFYFNNATGVGNILSTPTDLIQFINALFSYKLVSKSSLDSMMRFTKFKNIELFGMGMMKTPYYNKIGYGHAGDTHGTHSDLFYYKEDSLTIALVCNANNVSVNNIFESVLNICYNNAEDFAQYKKTNYNVTSEELNKYIGTYSSKQMPQKFVITKKDNQLYIQFGNQAAYPCKAIAKDKFEVTIASAILIFNTDKKELTFSQDRIQMTFTKDQ